jgi:hypothetical protein
MRGDAPNSDGTQPFHQATETRKKALLSPYFGIFSLQILCFEDFAKKWADHPIASRRKQRFYRRAQKKLGVYMQPEADELPARLDSRGCR